MAKHARCGYRAGRDRGQIAAHGLEGFGRNNRKRAGCFYCFLVFDLFKIDYIYVEPVLALLALYNNRAGEISCYCNIEVTVGVKKSVAGRRRGLVLKEYEIVFHISISFLCYIVAYDKRADVYHTPSW